MMARAHGDALAMKRLADLLRVVALEHEGEQLAFSRAVPVMRRARTVHMRSVAYASRSCS